MISRVFKNTRSLLLALVLGLLIWGGNIWQVSSVNLQDQDMIGYQWISHLMQGHSWVSGISFLLVLIIGILLFYLNEIYIFIRARTTVAATVFVVSVSSFSQLQTLSPGLIGSLFLVWALFKLFRVFKQEEPIWYIFDTSLILSSGSLFCFELNYFLPAVLIGLGILNTFSLRSFLTTLLGWILPYFILFSIYFYIDQLPELLILLERSFFVAGDYSLLTQAQQILIGGMGALLLVSLVFYSKEADRKKISSRKYFSIFLVFLLTIIVMIGVNMSPISHVWPLLCVLLSQYYAHFFSLGKGRFSTISFVFLLVLSLFSVYF